VQTLEMPAMSTLATWNELADLAKDVLILWFVAQGRYESAQSARALIKVRIAIGACGLAGDRALAATDDDSAWTECGAAFLRGISELCELSDEILRFMERDERSNFWTNRPQKLRQTSRDCSRLRAARRIPGEAIDPRARAPLLSAQLRLRRVGARTAASSRSASANAAASICAS